jgi:hypothetical protein
MKDLLNVPDILKIGVMAFVFIWLVNYGLTAAGLQQYKA